MMTTMNVSEFVAVVVVVTVVAVVSVGILFVTNERNTDWQ